MVFLDFRVFSNAAPGLEYNLGYDYSRLDVNWDALEGLNYLNYRGMGGGVYEPPGGWWAWNSYGGSLDYIATIC